MKFLNLFSTNIGSHMWKMTHEGSDFDIGRVDIMDSRSFLLGINIKGKHKKKDEDNLDIQTQEIGHLIRYLIKGNINAIWVVMSPIILSQYGTALTELREIVAANYSKNTYYSIHGLAKNNIHDFINNGDPQSLEYRKKLGIIGRTLNFGINLLMWNEAMFVPVTVKNAQEIEYLMSKLDATLEYSTLPEKVDREPFENYLIKYRLLKLRMDGYI